MADEHAASIAALRDWRHDPVTETVFRRIQELADEQHTNVHEALEKGEMQEAAKWNAGYFALLQVLNIVDDLVDDLKDEGGTV